MLGLLLGQHVAVAQQELAITLLLLPSHHSVTVPVDGRLRKLGILAGQLGLTDTGTLLAS